MSISDTDSTSSSSTSYEFNFNAWIEQNNFTTIKSIFIKHNMYSLNDLDMTSENFGPFIADIIGKDATLTQPVVQSIQSLQKLNSNTKDPIKIKIRATDEEFAVEDLIDNKLVELRKIQTNIKQLHNKHIENKKIECENIIKIENDITNAFGKITQQTNNEKTKLTNQFYQVVHNREELITKKIVIISNILQQINNEIESNSNQLKKVRELLDNNMQRDIRKQQILNIGKQIRKSNEYYQNELHKNDLYNIGSINNNIEMTMDKKSYDKIFKYLKKCFKLKYDCNIKITEQMEGKCDMGDEISENMSMNNNAINELKGIVLQKGNDINILENERNKLNENVKELNTIIVSKDKKIMTLENKINLLNNEIISKKSTIDIMNEKYNRIKNENGELRSNINKKQTFLDEKQFGKLQNDIKKLQAERMVKQGQWEKTCKKYAKLNKKYTFLEGENNNFKNELQNYEMKLNNKRETIKQLTIEINELKKNNINSEGTMNDWAEQIEQCMNENDNLKNKQKEYESERKDLLQQLKHLQKRTKDIERCKDEIKTLRDKCNEYRNKLNECNSNKLKRNVSVSNVSMAKRLQIDRKKKYQKFVKKMDRFKGDNNGRGFVERFLKLAGNMTIDYGTKHVSQGKEKQWCCWIRIKDIPITEECCHKQKKQAVNGCYRKVANVIEGWR